MANIIRYNVHAPLGNGGSRVGQFKTLQEAKTFAKGMDYTIWKVWYGKLRDGRRYIAHQVQM